MPPPFSATDVARLQPGDICLYAGTGFFSKLIQLKTWSRISHTEVYMGSGISYASRDGIGVRSFPFRDHGLAAVMRPVDAFDREAAVQWHNTQAVGQKYDWLGLFRFFTLGEQSTDKQFCSEYAVRLLRAGGAQVFAPGYDADLVSPGMFLSSPHAVVLWDDKVGWYGR